MTTPLPADPPALSSPLRIGRLTVRNRIMQTAHSKQYAENGVESDREIAYFVRRAQGGAGLVVAGNHFVHPTGSIRGFQDAFRPESVAPSRRLTDAVHEAGASIFVQLNHHGAQAMPEGPDGPRPVYAPSRLLSPSTGHATRAASAADIRMFVEGWAKSAAIAKQSGFDGVEVHMAHGYLLHQFLSPLYNARQDEYGGDAVGRSRFPREVLRAVRAAVGPDYPVGIRIVANDFMPGGLTAADARELIGIIHAETPVDFLDLAAGGYHNVHYVFPSSAMPAAWLRDEVAAVKAAFPDVPVFGVGAALSAEEAAEVVRSGVADMVALTRGQLADPDLALKLQQGRTSDITHCIRLNQGCLGRGSIGLPVACTVNPVAGRERERSVAARVPAAQSWVVVGGGPAGLRAAADLAAAGHRVTLFERESRLGGQLLAAARVPGRESIGLLVADLVRDVGRAGVDVRLGAAVDAAGLAALGADGIVVATGSRAAGAGTSLTSGGALSIELAGHPALTDADAALESAPGGAGEDAGEGATGQRIALIDDDGTAYASGIALTLLGRGHEVELVTPFETVFPHVRANYERQLLMERLHRHPFAHHVDSVVEAVDPPSEGGARSLALRNAKSGATTTIGGFDAIVLATPRESVPFPTAGVIDDSRVHVIGDAVSPRTIDAAIFEAFELAFAAGTAPAPVPDDMPAR
ncbi:oxidoreductase [Herbiconiux daphne]|uniref:NAD(P)-binding protein n=1 Tax=Herbiconiux daphne TaxID=2970914 RepID=A0ABT2H342_9MICO|nr:NAD(P)-binding protein [Herbiconiux daphne]MCS5734361.1 NAD(P)-binding protein [Herbiconiux daphne]